MIDFRNELPISFSPGMNFRLAVGHLRAYTVPNHLASSEFASTADSQGLTLPGKTGRQWIEQVGRIEFLHNSEFL